MSVEPEDGSFLLRLHAMTAAEREDELRSAIRASIDSLVHNDEVVTGLMAETSANGFGVTAFDFEVEMRSAECEVRVSFTADGEQIPDRVFTNNTIRGEFVAAIGDCGEVSFGRATAEIDEEDDQ